MRQQAFAFSTVADPTVELFVPGRNAELVQRVRALATPGGERFIYIWGNSGSGRTHVLKAAVALLERVGVRGLYVACDSAGALSDDLGAYGAIAVDDVDRLDAPSQVALFNTYNTFRERGGTLIASGDAPPTQLALRADLVTRLAWGLVYQVHALTDEEKADALVQHAAARGFRLDPEVRQYLLNRVPRDMPTLLAMLDALDRYSLEEKRAITVPLVRELLESQ